MLPLDSRIISSRSVFYISYIGIGLIIAEAYIFSTENIMLVTICRQYNPNNLALLTQVYTRYILKVVFLASEICKTLCDTVSSH